MVFFCVCKEGKQQNMENITLGQVALALSFILLLIGNIKSLIKEFKNPIDKRISEMLEPIQKEIVDIKDNISTLEVNDLKTDLVNFMGMAEMGAVTEEQKIRGHELYDKYREKGGNSYIHDQWEKLKKEGKL